MAMTIKIYKNEIVEYVKSLISKSKVKRLK